MYFLPVLLVIISMSQNASLDVTVGYKLSVQHDQANAETGIR